MDDNSKKTKTMYQPSKLGRKGDPRMHTAVSSRIVNPDLTPLEALQKGGFTFYTAEDGNMYDTDNISVSQRKNQLSRRLRSLRTEAQYTGLWQQKQQVFT